MPGSHIEYYIRFRIGIQRVRRFFQSEIKLHLFFIDKICDKSGAMLLYDNHSDKFYKNE